MREYASLCIIIQTGTRVSSEIVAKGPDRSGISSCRESRELIRLRFRRICRRSVGVCSISFSQALATLQGLFLFWRNDPGDLLSGILANLSDLAPLLLRTERGIVVHFLDLRFRIAHDGLPCAHRFLRNSRFPPACGACGRCRGARRALIGSSVIGRCALRPSRGLGV